MIIDEWKLVHYTDLTTLINEFYKNVYNFKRLKNIIKDSNISTINYNSYVSLLEFQIEQNTRRFSQILKKEFKKNISNDKVIRNKRGLIDGLGTLVKTLTGNLDAKDGQRIDSHLLKLESNEKQMKDLIQQQIKVTSSLNKYVNETMLKVLSNNEIIANRIAKFEDLLNNVNLSEFSHVLKIQNLCTQLIEANNLIEMILGEIQTAITFAQRNVLHPSVIDNKLLFVELKEIAKHLEYYRLPFPIQSNFVSIYEKIIEVQAYVSENRIVYILNIPVVEYQSYKHYHLYSLPTAANNSSYFTAIVPSKKFVHVNEFQYVLTNEPCERIVNDQYLCKHKDILKVSNDNPCEVNLLLGNYNFENCKMINMQVSDVKIQKLENNMWLVVTVQPIAMAYQCNQTESNVMLKGNIVLSLEKFCEARIGKHNLKTLQRNVNIIKSVMYIPTLNVDKFLNNVHDVKYLKPLKLSNVNLDELSSIQNDLVNMQHKALRLDFNYATSTNYYYLIVIAGIICMIILRYVYVKIKPKCLKRVSSGSPQFFVKFCKQSDNAQVELREMPKSESDPMAFKLKIPASSPP